VFKWSSYTMIKKLTIVAIAGIVLSACSNMMEGLGKDMQTMGNSMGGNSSNTNANQSQTKGKDVVVTPVK
jgi:predicted small secreted protein